MNKRLRILACMVALLAAPAYGVTVEKPLGDMRLEQEARTLFMQLKCVVCEGQPLAESDAELAVDMRAMIRSKLQNGETPDQILAYFTARYGDAILLAPPLSGNSALLWVMPLVVLLCGAYIFLRSVKRRRA